jgi:TolA-binding protein
VSLRALGLAAIAAWLVACGGPAYAPGYIEAFDAGRRARTAGRLEEAEEQFALAYRRAGRVKDRDEALLLQARTQEAQGHPDDAARTYQLLVDARPVGPRAVDGSFALARLAGAARGEETQDAMERELIAKHPDHGLAVAALSRVVGRRREKKDWDGLLRALDPLVAPTRGTPMEQPIDMERAKALEARGDLQGALALYLATARAHPYPFGPRTDDALFRASEVEEKLGRHDLAIAHLREMLEPREHSQTVSSYERPKFPAAQMRIALLLRDRTRDHAAARKELYRFVDGFPASTMRDDALWIAARMARDDGDEETACDDVERLVETMPDSRYVRCAHLVCAEVPPSARECAPYVVRELNGEVAGEPGDLVDDEASVREGEQKPAVPAPDRVPDVEAP